MKTYKLSSRKKRRKKKNPAKRRIRRKPVIKHRKRRVYARRRKNPIGRKKTMRRKRRRSSIKPKRRIRRRRRNPGGFNFLDMIQQSVLAGIGGIGCLAGSTFIARAAKLEDSKQQNFISIILAVMAAIMLPRALKAEQANPLIGGIWAVTWIKILKFIMPEDMQEFLVLGNNNTGKVDYLVNQMLGQDQMQTIINPETELLGIAENDMMGIAENVEGYTHDQFDAQIW